jgi:hypothetical protein
VIIAIRIQACFYLHPDPGKQNLKFSKARSKGSTFLHIQKRSPVFISYAIATKCKKGSAAEAAKWIECGSMQKPDPKYIYALCFHFPFTEFSVLDAHLFIFSL